MVSKRWMSIDRMRGGGSVIRTWRSAWSTTMPAGASQMSNPADTMPA